jgi:hypothetical protein
MYIALGKHSLGGEAIFPLFCGMRSTEGGEEKRKCMAICGQRAAIREAGNPDFDCYTS